MVRTYHYTLELTTGTPVSLKKTGTPGDIIKQLIIQADGANAALAYIGSPEGEATLSSTSYGFRIEIPVTTIPGAPTIIEAVNVSLASLYALGTTNDKLHILVLMA